MQTQQHIMSVIFKYLVILVVILLFGACGDGDNGSTSPTALSPVGTWGVTFSNATAKAYKDYDHLISNAAAKAYDDYDRILVVRKENGEVIFKLPDGGDTFYGTWTYSVDLSTIYIDAEHTLYGYTIYLEGTLSQDGKTINGTYRTSDGRSGVWSADYLEDVDM